MYLHSPQQLYYNEKLALCEVVVYNQNGFAHTQEYNEKNGDKEPILSEETIASLMVLGQILDKIHNRLVGEGRTASGKVIEKNYEH